MLSFQWNFLIHNSFWQCWWDYNWTQVWLLAAVKAKLMRQVLVRRKNVYSSAGDLSGWGDCFPKADFNISVQAEVFVRKQKESRTKRPAGGVPAGADTDFHSQCPGVDHLAEFLWLGAVRSGCSWGAHRNWNCWF